MRTFSTRYACLATAFSITLTVSAGCRGPEAASPGTPPPAAAAAAPAQQGGLDPDVAAAVEQVLGAGQHPWLRWSEVADVAPALKAVYEAEPDRLFWFNGPTPHAQTKTAVAALAAAGDHGLDPADYDAVRLTDEWTALEAGTAHAVDRAMFDTALTVSVARLISAAHRGRVDPSTLHWGYDVAPKRLDLPSTLADAREKGVAQTLDGVEPPFAHYDRARKTLRDYKARAAAGEPAAVPELPKGRTKVEPGKPWASVPQLAARLAAYGHLDADAAQRVQRGGGDAPLYAGSLVDAVKEFQHRHGLEPDGVIGAGTLAALNVPLERRVRQIELALERMRWLPSMGDRPTIFVNVPLYRLWATDPASGDEPLRMNVIVGKALNHRTPIFIDQMEYVIFRPYWNPPYGIAVQEIVPHARRDSSYFDRENLEIVASGADDAPALPPTPDNLAKVVAGKLHIRQKPGPKNSLGLAKFIFPNAENVYMHGTPAQALFSRTRRDFSHGCIRLEDPARFAEWVLRDQKEWTRDRIDTAMQADRPTRVNLTHPLAVVLFYDTVHVNSEGEVFFVDDIYGHDRQLDAALQHGYPYPTKG